jgi:thiol-disulfide isomerase/thioredoxin
MRRPLLTIALAVVGFVLFLSILSNKGGPSGGDGLLPNGPAPPMAIKTTDGKTKSLADLRGKVVVVKFWATWCGPCAMSTPRMVELYEKHKGEGLEVLGVALERDDGGNIPAYVREMGVTYPVGMPDPPDSVREWIQPSTGIPTIFVVDKKGKVRWSKSGFDPSRESDVEDAVVACLRE